MQRAGTATAVPAPGVGAVPDASTDTDRLLAAGERIERVLERGAPGSPVAREDARDLVRVLTELYGAGLERVLDLVDEAGVLDDALLARLAGDPLVGSLLMVHGLHPYSVRERVERALTNVRARTEGRGVSVELVEGAAEGRVLIRVEGGSGCASTSAAVTEMVRAAVEDAVPDAGTVEIEQVAAGGSGGAFIPVGSLLRNRPVGDTAGSAAAMAAAAGDVAARKPVGA